MDLHKSTTDPESRLNCKVNAAPALPSSLGRVLTDSRHGLAVNLRTSNSDGKAEPAALMLANVPGPSNRVRMGANKAYNTKGFVKACSDANVAPRMVQEKDRNRGASTERRSTRYAGNEIWRHKREHIEQGVDQRLRLTMAAHNLKWLRALAHWRPRCAQRAPGRPKCFLQPARLTAQRVKCKLASCICEPSDLTESNGHGELVPMSGYGRRPQNSLRSKAFTSDHCKHEI